MGNSKRRFQSYQRLILWSLLVASMGNSCDSFGVRYPRLIEEYDSTGHLQKRYQANQNGQRDGEYFEYFNNEKVRFFYHYQSDRLNGQFKEFNEDGSVYCIGYYRNAALDSIIKFYYPNGILKAENYRYQGELFGIQKEYYPDNALSSAYFLANDSDQVFSMTFDKEMGITKNNGLIYCVYDKSKFLLGDSINLIYYTFVPPHCTYQAEIIEQSQQKTVRHKVHLKNINNNSAILYTSKPDKKGIFKIGFVISLFDKFAGKVLADSSFVSTTVL